MEAAVTPSCSPAEPDTRSLQHDGFAGPWPLSLVITSQLDALRLQLTRCNDRQNLHSRSSNALLVISDSSIRSRVLQHFGYGYRLWRTNFFHRPAGSYHPGVGWHHDKHFQDGRRELDFDETGDHLSILVALDAMTFETGCFQYIPGSHRHVGSFQRDVRPYDDRPYEEHFLHLPEWLAATAVEVEIPSGYFCLFHSALLHGSLPSDGSAARSSMVGRLVRNHVEIPASLATPSDIVLWC